MGNTFLFPGQGSQFVGMGRDLFETFDSVQERFSRAEEVLRKELSRVVFEGPPEELMATENTQPALFVLEVSIADLIMENGIQPVFTAGHSLGEYSALYAAGVITFEDGLRLVARRGSLMARAGSERPGSMAAVIGLERSKISEILGSIKSGIVVAANENTPQQTVISGETEAVKDACVVLKSSGAKRAVLLPVSGAFHSPLMSDAAKEFRGMLDSVTFLKPRCPVVTNVSAEVVSDHQALKEQLVHQLVSPVRWVDSMNRLSELNHGICVECGPGTVLKGLVAKCVPSINVVPCGTVENIYSLLNQS